MMLFQYKDYDVINIKGELCLFYIAQLFLKAFFICIPKHWNCDSDGTVDCTTVGVYD